MADDTGTKLLALLGLLISLAVTLGSSMAVTIYLLKAAAAPVLIWVCFWISWGVALLTGIAGAIGKVLDES